MMKRIIIVITSLLVGIILLSLVFMIVGGIISGALFNPRITQEQMERIFVEDYDLLALVVQFFEDSSHGNVYFRREYMNYSILFTDGGDRIDVEDNYELEIVRQLMHRGYSVIGTRGNTVYFLRWAGRDRGSGIAFSMDGNEPTSETISFLTRLEPLPKPNWYFYEADFREWDRRRRAMLETTPSCD